MIWKAFWRAGAPRSTTTTPGGSIRQEAVPANRGSPWPPLPRWSRPGRHAVSGCRDPLDARAINTSLPAPWPRSRRRGTVRPVAARSPAPFLSDMSAPGQRPCTEVSAPRHRWQSAVSLYFSSTARRVRRLRSRCHASGRSATSNTVCRIAARLVGEGQPEDVCSIPASRVTSGISPAAIDWTTEPGSPSGSSEGSRTRSAAPLAELRLLT